jgi:hypothetical protein
MLKISITNLNIQIYRARQQLLSCASAAARLADIVERCRGRLRLGDFQFEIARDVRFQSPGSAPGPAPASDDPPSSPPASPASGIVLGTGGTGSGRLGTICGRGVSGGGSDAPLP